MGDRVGKRAVGIKLDHGRDGSDDPIGLIQTLESSLEDLRSLITCRVCVRPLFEPYTIECGHTFCYGCLVRWFERDRTTKSCPDCRADVLRPPAPAYLVRDMTQIFGNRAELMPVGETTEEHRKWKEEEAALVEKDRATTGLKGGLFRGCFRPKRRRQRSVIRDDEDGVNRCPRCTWELEDGLCESCGYPDGEDSDSDGRESWDDDHYDIDEAFMGEIVGALDEDAHMDEYGPNIGSEHDYSSEDGSSDESPPRMRRRDRRIVEEENPYEDAEEAMPYDNFPIHSTDESSEDEEVGSLDGFVVNDVGPGTQSVTSSPRSLQWETDQGTDGEQQIPDNDQFSQDEGFSTRNETSPTNVQYDPEDESDEGPILRSRRQVRRRSGASNHSSGSDGNGGSGVSQALNALRVRNGYNSSDISANSREENSHENPDVSDERFRIIPIEVESDSDSPVPAQHARRRRAVPNHLPPDDDSDMEASSGTVTVGRDSPKPSGGLMTVRDGSSVPAGQSSNALSPILIESSPTRSPNRQLAVPGAFPQRSPSAIPPSSFLPNSSQRICRRAPARASHVADNPLEGMSRRSTTSSSPSNGLQQRRGTRRRSPLPPRERPISPTSRQSHSPTAMELFEQGRRDRQAQKNERRAERRRLKAEREQR